MKVIKVDLIKMADNSEFDVILHGCNCFCVMGAGIALGVKNKFPEVYKADKATLTGDIDKLGKHSFVTVKNNKGDDLTVFNCYSQYHYKFTNKKAPVDYDAIKKSLTLMVAEIKLNTNKVFQIGLPLIGYGLAGGDLIPILNIFYDVLHDLNATIVVYEKEKHADELLKIIESFFKIKDYIKQFKL